MLNPNVNNISLCSSEYEQYARHLILDQIEITGQKRLKTSKILCIGAGGLACPCIVYLIRSGISCIGVIDHDNVSYSNLSRQILYTDENINLPKVTCLKENIKIDNKTSIIIPYIQKLDHENAKNIIQNYDIIIDTCDDFNTRYIIEKACYQLHKIHIYGAISQLEGQISVFNYNSGPQYSDLYPLSLKLKRYNCNNNGVLGVVTGVIGILQASEALKVILGLKNILSGKILLYNFIESSFKIIKIYKKRVEIPIETNSNKKNSEYIQDINNFKEMHAKNQVFIDVRQNIEFKQKHIKKAINIPLNNLINKSTKSLLKSYFQNKNLTTYCSGNSRSLKSSQILANYKIYNLRIKSGLNNITFN
uniref:Rhodanese domain-containing protein n=1 Tax=Gastroclonium compressum TaxID=1852973 RepID=A0A173G097_GASCM|nr:hypothetical protein [Coeloseira compressa]ANH09699.1 hypothetical protein [Coeloseira compressa]